MRFNFRKVDLRGSGGSMGESIDDEDTGKSVGGIVYGTGPRSRSISLFGKYRGTFATHEECVAFTKGVEAVLNHMITDEG